MGSRIAARWCTVLIRFKVSSHFKSGVTMQVHLYEGTTVMEAALDDPRTGAAIACVERNNESGREHLCFLERSLQSALKTSEEEIQCDSHQQRTLPGRRAI